MGSKCCTDRKAEVLGRKIEPFRYGSTPFEDDDFAEAEDDDESVTMVAPPVLSRRISWNRTSRYRNGCKHLEDHGCAIAKNESEDLRVTTPQVLTELQTGKTAILEAVASQSFTVDPFAKSPSEASKEHLYEQPLYKDRGWVGMKIETVVPLSVIASQVANFQPAVPVESTKEQTWDGYVANEEGLHHATHVLSDNVAIGLELRNQGKNSCGEIRPMHARRRTSVPCLRRQEPVPVRNRVGSIERRIKYSILTQGKIEDSKQMVLGCSFPKGLVE